MDLQKRLPRIYQLAKECPEETFYRIMRFYLARYAKQNPFNYSESELDRKIISILYEGIAGEILPAIELYFLFTDDDVNKIKDDEVHPPPLICAVIGDKLSVAEYLLNLGADVDGKDLNGITAIQVALCLKRTEICQRLLFKKYNVVLSDAEAVVEFLLDYPEEFYDKDGFSTLLYYASEISKDAFKLALSVSVVTDFYAPMPFYITDKFHNFFVHLLHTNKCKARVKLAIEKMGTVELRAFFCDEDLVEIALEYNPKIVPLLLEKLRYYEIYICRDGRNISDLNYRIIKLKTKYIFEKCGINVYKYTSNNQNRLYQIEVRSFGIEVILFELENGENINHLDIENYPPLQHNLEFDHMYDPNLTETCVHYLASIVTKMIDNGEFINQENYRVLQDPDIIDYYNECREELTRLKNKHLVRHLSHYDILCCNLHKFFELGRTMKNLPFPQENSMEFPIYFAQLNRNVQRSIWRLREITRIFKITDPFIPQLIVENVCGRLNDMNLRKSKYYFKLLTQLLYERQLPVE